LLNQRFFLTRGLEAYVSTLNPDITQAEFDRLAASVLAGQSGIKSLSLYRNNVITHIYPLEGSEKAIGFDPTTIPAEKQAIQRAIDTRKTIVAGPLTLVEDGVVALIARTPIFLPPAPGSGSDTGSYWGLSGIILDEEALLQDAGLLDPGSSLNYSLRGKDGLGEAGEVFLGEAQLFEQDPVQLQINLPNGSWQLAAIPKAGWPQRAPISGWLWLAGGIVAPSLGIFLFQLVSAPQRLQKAVDRATAALQESEKALQQANSELEERVDQRTAQVRVANQEITVLNDRLKAENLRMSAELDITRRLQQMILPRPEELEQILDLEIAGFMEPANEVGGDYYDVLQGDGHIKIGIGDVTGHGLESGVLMIMVQTAVRTLLASQEADPKRFLSTLNKVIHGNVQRIQSDKNMTLALLDYHKGLLSLTGQHEEIILVRANGGVERIDTFDLGFPIGLEAEIDAFVGKMEIRLETGDMVILYTDGVTEASNPQKNQYGLERLCEVVSQHKDRSAAEIRQAVVQDVRQHIGDQTVFDDITLLVIKQK
jgi:serine phosphatase RsbU (regulator of sigma subunit)/sensor domain CHASE-containing protein